MMKSVRAYQGAYAEMLADYAISVEQLRRDVMVVAEDGGEALGFYSLIVEGEAELDLLFVSDRAQGTGLGKLLFDDMRQAAAVRNIASVLIVSHPPSVGFYERMGAVRIGTRPPAGRVAWERPILRLDVT